MEYKSFNPDVQVSGAVVAAFTAAFPRGTEELGAKLLGLHGIRKPEMDGWYQLQSLLDAMEDVSEQMGLEMLRRIGEQIAGNALLPPGWNSIENVLAGIDNAYHMNHKGGEIGHYNFSDEGLLSGLRRIRMECPNPYPCVFDLGTIDGFAKRFKPAGCIDMVVRHDETRPCRRQGAESCTYLISWC
jgi:hypothetical protein